MSRVYIFGPIFLFGKSYISTYKALWRLCARHFDEVVCTYPDFWDFKGSAEEFYRETVRKIMDSDLFIAEVSSPSTGVGMELQMGVERMIPTLALLKEGQETSSMVTGMPTLRKVITYGSRPDLERKVEEFLEGFAHPVKLGEVKRVGQVTI